LLVTFVLDCCNREAMSRVATTGDRSGDVVRDVMLAAAETRFGNVSKAPAGIEWLADNGSGYMAEKRAILPLGSSITTSNTLIAR
jgi:putative transposase